MQRRDFLKLTCGGGAGVAAATLSPSVAARPNHEPLPDAVGMLYDATLCVGCQACVAKCKEVNNMPASNPEKPEWDESQHLSGETLNIIKIYEQGTAETKDQAEDGYSYIKRQCMHCVDPDCVSACPVTAMTKDPKTGIVMHNPDQCIGCRYCMVACPFNIPKYEYDNPFGEIQKCQLCNQKGVERIDNGLLPGCVEVCPTGGVIFGKRKDLLKEAKRRMALKAGEVYAYPRETVDADYTHEKEVPQYIPHIYGEKEGGGTQVLVLAGVEHDLLGLPILPERASGARTETLQHRLYRGLALPAAALAGLAFLVRRNTKMQHGEAEQETAEATQEKDNG